MKAVKYWLSSQIMVQYEQANPWSWHRLVEYYMFTICHLICSSRCGWRMWQCWVRMLLWMMNSTSMVPMYCLISPLPSRYQSHASSCSNSEHQDLDQPMGPCLSCPLPGVSPPCALAAGALCWISNWAFPWIKILILHSSPLRGILWRSITGGNYGYVNWSATWNQCLEI